MSLSFLNIFCIVRDIPKGTLHAHEKGILQNIASRLGHNEHAFPSIDEIANNLDVDRQTVIKYTKTLVESEFLIKIPVPGRSNRYKINIDKLLVISKSKIKSDPPLQSEPSYDTGHTRGYATHTPPICHAYPKVENKYKYKKLSLSSRVVSPPVDNPPSCGTTDKTYLSKNPTAKPPTLVYTEDRKIKNIQIAQSEDTTSGILYYRRHFEQQDRKKSSSPPKNVVQNLQNFQPSYAHKELAEGLGLDFPHQLKRFIETNLAKKTIIYDIDKMFKGWLEQGAENIRKKIAECETQFGKFKLKPPTKMELTPEKSWPYGDTKSNIPTPAPKKQPAYVPYKMPEPEPIAYDDYLRELEERFGTQIVNDLLINRNKRSNLCSM